MDLDTVLGAPPAHLPPRRLSRIFRDLAKHAEDRVTIGEIRQALGDRSFATLLVFFASLNLLPFPPGSTLVLGPPLVLVALQMVMGNRTVWLPQFLLNKAIGADKFRHMSERLIPRLIWLERLIKPRYWPFARDHADRVIGLAALILSIAVTLPIPLGNWFPAFSCALWWGSLFPSAMVCCSGIAVACGVLSLLVIAGVVIGASMMAGAVMH